MICLDFDWQIDEFMVYCRSTQLRKKRCFLMNKPCDYLRRKHILSVKTVVMCFLFLRFGLCFDEENEGVLPGGWNSRTPGDGCPYASIPCFVIIHFRGLLSMYSQVLS